MQHKEIKAEILAFTYKEELEDSNILLTIQCSEDDGEISTKSADKLRELYAETLENLLPYSYYQKADDDDREYSRKACGH